MSDRELTQIVPEPNWYEYQESKTPEEITNLSGSGADPTHHITLTDGYKTVGFVITDQTGDRDERTLRRFPQAEPKTPYVTEKQDTFGGGFGQSAFEENRSKYWRSRGVDTTKDALVLAPMFHYAKGTFRKAQEFMPTSSAYWVKLAGVHGWRAMPFTPLQEWLSTTYLKLFIQKIDAAPTLRIRIYTDTASKPGDLIHTEDIAASTITNPDGEWVRFAIADTHTYGADTQFWVVLTYTGTSKSGSWRILSQNHTVGLKSTDGASWTNGRDFFFRIEGPGDSFSAKFFDYKKQMYTLLRFDSNADSTMWMNGWRGACDANTGALTKLKDDTQDWSGGLITGAEVAQIVAGPASSELEDQRGVASGADNEVTVDDAWIFTHADDDEYVITNSDWFFAITHASLLNGRVTDVAVADGVAYICRGSNRRVTLFRDYNATGTWTHGWGGSLSKAHFVQTVNDPISGDILWFGYNRSKEGEYKPYVWQADPLPWGRYGLPLVELALNHPAGSMEKWVASTGDVAITGGGGSVTKITVTVHEVDTVGVDTAGENYEVGDDLTLVDAVSSGTAVVNVDSVDEGGEVLTVSVVTPGFDYTTGAKETTGGAGTGCLIDITGLGGFGTGQFAYINLLDAEGANTTYDIRFMTFLETMLWYNFVTNRSNWIEVLDAGAIEVDLDDSQGAATPFESIAIPELQIRDSSVSHRRFTLDVATTEGAAQLTAIGLNLKVEQSYSFTLTLQGNWNAYSRMRPVTVGQVDGDNITGLESFGDPETAWVFTEAGFGQLKNNKFLPTPNRELKIARNSNNGKGHDVHDVYLMFTWQGRLQRYYRQNIDDLGPDFPAGMGDIAGEIVDVRTYPGRIYVAVDGGTGGKSLILCHKGGAWHEVYTSFEGERIRNLFVQSIEGKSDKLWAAIGCDLMWFPIALNAAEKPAHSDYTYCPLGYLDTSWIYTSSRELDKVFRSVLATMEQAKDDDLYLDIYFKVDDEDAPWEKVAYKTTKSASTIEYHFTGIEPTDVVRGNRLKIRIALRTKDLAKSPIVRSIQNRIYRLQEVKFNYTFISKLSTISINLRGDEEKVIGTFGTIQAAFNVLDTWAATLTPLRVTSDIGLFNDILVVIEPLPAQLLLLVHDERIQEQSIQVAANEI